MNRVVLIGRLVRDPELRSTTTGKDVAEFTIAVDKRIKPTDGSPTADFFRVKAWGHSARFVGDYLTKGRLVAVDGRIETRKYTDNEGRNREIVEIIAENVNGLDRPRDDAETAPKQERRAESSSQSSDEYDPFANE
jgi:single-strand DNA-binding protein